MGIPVLILGESGSGKSTSMRNFEPDEISIFNVAGKPLPFKKKIPKVNTSDYNKIKAGLKQSSKKAFAIDDSQYLLCFEMFEKAKETGFNKFTDMALNFYNLIQFIIKQLPDDVIVYFLHHVETTADGKQKAKTIGKMLDEKLTVEGLFSIVLLCETDGIDYKFITQSDGYTTAKSPMDMFDKSIDNDLKIVDTTIREYWELNPIKNDIKNEEETIND